MQHGVAVKSRWFHDADGCPGCGRKVTSMKFKGQNAMSLNAYIYREHAVLIAYLLCGKCARRIIRDAEADPLASTTTLHAAIEKNLKQAFLKNLGH
jgi:predicted metal-binding protein